MQWTALHRELIKLARKTKKTIIINIGITDKKWETTYKYQTSDHSNRKQTDLWPTQTHTEKGKGILFEGGGVTTSPTICIEPPITFSAWAAKYTRIQSKMLISFDIHYLLANIFLSISLPNHFRNRAKRKYEDPKPLKHPYKWVSSQHSILKTKKKIWVTHKRTSKESVSAQPQLSSLWRHWDRKELRMAGIIIFGET